MQRCWKQAVVERQRGLDQASSSGRRIKMSHICFCASDCAELRGFGAGAERLRQCRNLDGISEWRARAMRFDIANSRRIDTCRRMRATDGRRPAHPRWAR